MGSKSQFAIEFIALLAFMFLIFLGVTALITSSILDAKDKERLEIAEDISSMAKNEIDLALAASNGYTRAFELPMTVGGSGYNIRILENRELIVDYIDKEHVSFLPTAKNDLGEQIPRVCGDIFVPGNEISKENNVVCVNANLDLVQCANAELLGLCDQLDQDFLPGTKCCCQQRYGKCNP